MPCFTFGTRLVTCLTFIGSLVIGCSSGDDEPKSGDGVNDVKLACELRTTWNRSKQDCGLCEAAVIAPRCDCSELAAYSAACSDQQEARRKACAESVDNCVLACNRDDCACIERCYADADDACKKASDARDGCIGEACASYCQ